jgi:2-dehydro-3-deoxy-D-arabinonate dehydratase
MQLCRFFDPDLGARLGAVLDERVVDLSASDQQPFASFSALLHASTSTPLPALLDGLELSALPVVDYAELERAPAPGHRHLLPPVDRQEIWAAGVTYAWSREARVREAQAKDVYVRVYEAARPELFFKSLGEKAIGPNDWIGLRGDSDWNVPEPELTLALNPHMEIVGYTVGNDVSSRDIEGENPLYLPQAKVYRRSCALGPVITLASVYEELDPHNLQVHLTITRSGQTIFQGETNTGKMHRRVTQLAEYLGRYADFPHGALLMTGTGIVPPDEFTLQDGDQVAIEIEKIGVLRNHVQQMR